MMDSLGGSELMDPMAALLEGLEGGWPQGEECYPDLRERMASDPKFKLEVATHEAAHAFWGNQLGRTIRKISLIPPETSFDINGWISTRDAYLNRLKYRLASDMESWIGDIPPLDTTMAMDDESFFKMMSAIKPDYPVDPFAAFSTTRVSPKTIPVRFPYVPTMQRIVWTDDNPLHRPPTKLDLAIMKAFMPIMGPFYGKTWANIRDVDPHAEIASFTDWLCLETPTDQHYLHNYVSHGKERFFWHTSLKVINDCGGHNDYWDVLHSVEEPNTEEENLCIQEAISGMSIQDMVLATFLSPLQLLYPNKARIMFAINGLAKALISRGTLDGPTAIRVLTNYRISYEKIETGLKKDHTPDYLAAKRWEAMFNQHVISHLNASLHHQLKDCSKGYIRAVEYFNDPKWTPVVADAAYNRYNDPNWFTWTGQPFKQGRLTTTASPLL